MTNSGTTPRCYAGTKRRSGKRQPIVNPRACIKLQLGGRRKARDHPMEYPMVNRQTAVVLFAHGSGVPEANRQVASVAGEISRRSGCAAGCAFLEIAQPDLAAAVATLAQGGARRIVVVPYFLTMGVHVGQDLPRLIDAQRVRFPEVEFLLGQPLEGSPGLPALILERVREVLPEGQPF
jgi:hypothetical protein